MKLATSQIDQQIHAHDETVSTSNVCLHTLYTKASTFIHEQSLWLYQTSSLKNLMSVVRPCRGRISTAWHRTISSVLFRSVSQSSLQRSQYTRVHDNALPSDTQDRSLWGPLEEWVCNTYTKNKSSLVICIYSACTVHLLHCIHCYCHYFNTILKKIHSFTEYTFCINKHGNSQLNPPAKWSISKVNWLFTVL